MGCRPARCRTNVGEAVELFSCCCPVHLRSERLSSVAMQLKANRTAGTAGTAAEQPVLRAVPAVPVGCIATDDPSSVVVWHQDVG